MVKPPASVGDQLLSPEATWQRFDDTDNKIKYSGMWVYQAGIDNYNGGSTIIPTSATTTEIQNTRCDFYFVGTKLRIISAYYSGNSANFAIEIDGVTNIVTTKDSTLRFQCIVFEKLDLEKVAHHVRIYSNDTDRISLDAIDIDSNGYLITEAEYSQGNRFPVLIGDDTVTSEENIANYAKTLINGEKQLLVSSTLESIYVTDGTGLFTKVASKGINTQEITDIESNVTTVVTNNVKADFFSKTDTQEYLDSKISNKVDKVDGYSLSENNFSTTYKNKLDSLDTSNFVEDSSYVHTDNNFSNIYKMKIDNLTNDTKYIGMFDTISDRDSYSGDLIVGLWCSILVDTNYGSKKTKYIYNGIQWIYAGTYSDDTILIDDSATTETNVTWSAYKITNELNLKSNKTEIDANFNSINTELDKKLEVANLKQGTNVSLDVDQYGNITINATGGTGTGNGSNNYELMSNKPKINGITILGNKTSNDLKLLSNSYASTENEGSVKMADKAKMIDVTGQLNGSIQYYGVGNGGALSDTVLKLRPFPVGTITNRIDTLTFDLLTKDVPQSIPFVREIPDVNCFAQAFKKETDSINKTDTFEDYTNELVSNHSENIICDAANGLSINDIHEYATALNSDGVYETDIINIDDFTEIIKIK